MQPGGTALLALTGIPPEEVPAGATQAVTPPPKPGSIGGVVWRDFKPGGGTPGKVETEELGLPGVKVELRDSSGKTVETARARTTEASSSPDVSSGAYSGRDQLRDVPARLSRASTGSVRR